MIPTVMYKVKRPTAPKPPSIPVDLEDSPLLDAIRAYLDGR